jgi:foldase protein PrsA
VGGTALAVIAAGILIQVFRAQPAFPQSGAGKSGAAADPNAKGKPGEARPGQERLARVNGEYISYDDVASECMLRHGEEVLDALVNRKLIEQACKARGIEISDAEISAEVMKIAKKFNMAVDQWYQMLATERKIAPLQYRRDVIWPMLALRRLAGEEIVVTNEDLKKAFERHYGPRVKARAIVLNNLRHATEVWAKAKANPENFGKLAAEFSVEPGSRALEGAIPPIPRFSGNPELEREAFKLKEGEISAVIQLPTTSQYIILLCEGRTEQVIDDPSRVEAQLRDELKEEKMQEAVAAVFERVKTEARIDNYLTRQSTGGKKKAGTANAGPTGGKIVPASGTKPASAGSASKSGGGSSNPAAPPGATAAPAKKSVAASPIPR